MEKLLIKKNIAISSAHNIAFTDIGMCGNTVVELPAVACTLHQGYWFGSRPSQPSLPERGELEEDSARKDRELTCSSDARKPL